MAVTITKAEWEDYFSVQNSGRINMILHPLIHKFMPDGNWKAAHDHFEVDGNEDDIVLENGSEL